MKHCDDYIDDETQPKCLRDCLRYHRLPAHKKYPFEGFPPRVPTLFASYLGKGVQVVFASRIGDVGITADLTPGAQYTQRVMVEELTDFKA